MNRDPDTEPLASSDDLGLSAFRSEEGLDRLTSLLANLGGTPLAAFWVVDAGQQFLASAHGNISRALPQHSEFGRRALQADGLLEITDARKDAHLARDPLVAGAPALRFFASTPVRDRSGRHIGALCLMDTEARPLGAAGRAALEALSALLEDHMRLRADVLHDPQTGVLTRRQFDDIADREWRRAMRAMVPISVIVAELDRLGDFAQEGNAALDRGIRAAALAMQYSVHRPGDCVGRLDSTRFATLLYGTDAASATRIAERVRLAVDALQIPFPRQGGVLTLSQGVATIPADQLTRCDLEGALAIGTAALERALSSGGNCWQSAPLTATA